VLRNPHVQPAACEAALGGVDGRRLSLWQSYHGERPLRRMPFRTVLPPYHTAVAVALGKIEAGYPSVRENAHCL
jgi:hypothetical protein